MRFINRPKFLLSSSVALCLCGCIYFAASARAEEAKKVNYQDDILPIFRNACLNCHNPDKKKAGLDLSTYAPMMTGSDDGVVIKPGDPSTSKLCKVILQSEEPFMPPKADKLPQKELDLIKQWIAIGCPETSGSKVMVAKKPAVDLTAVVATGRPAGPPPMPQGGWPLDSLVRTTRPGALMSLAASPWAPLVAVGSQHQILLYNSDTLDLLGMLPFSEGQPNIIRFSRNGKLIICGGGQAAKSGKVVTWDVATGKRVTEVGDEFDAVLAADITPDQQMIALGGPSKVLKAFYTADGKSAWTVKKHTDWVTAVAFSPDGVMCASGDRAGNLYVWEAKNGRDFYTLAGHKDAITELVFRDDSNVLASASADGTVKIWNMHDGAQLSNINANGSGVTCVNYTHDGRLVTTGRDNVTKSWKADGSQERALDAFADVALRCTFTHDGNRIIAGDWSGTIRVWNAAEGAKVGELSSNPVTPQEKLAAVSKQVEELSIAAKTGSTDLGNAEASAKKCGDELTAARSAKGGGEVEAQANAVRSSRANVQQAQTALDQAKANAENKKNEAARLDVERTQAQIASENAMKGPGRSALKQRYAAAVKAADAAAAAVKPAMDQIPVAEKNLEARKTALKGAEEKLNTAIAAADPLAKALPDKWTAATNANDNLAKYKLAAEVANNKLAVATTEMNRLKAFIASRSGPAQVSHEGPTTKPAGNKT